MICSTDTGARRGVKERLNLKEITSKARKMARVATSGKMAPTTKANSSTRCFRAKVSTTHASYMSAGIYFFAESEKTYEGQFAANVFEGNGKLSFKDGRRYEGQFKAGKKQG